MAEVPIYNGPALAEWIETRPEFQRSLDDNLKRIVRHWRSGAHAPETSVDALLCKLGMHLSEVPTWAVTGYPKRAVTGLGVQVIDGRVSLVREAA